MSPPRVVGRFALYNEIASGGMATVHLGRLLGSNGVHRLVAIKRLHAQFAKDPEFVRMFLDEGRLAARIHHPNVVSLLDFISLEGELFLVMEYVHGDSLSGLLRAARGKEEPVPIKIAASLIVDVLQGLHAAHTAKDERGEPLDIVHRDVSPENVLVSSDGVARLLDFGVAKAADRLQTTRVGQIKGKISYMAPEQLRSEPVDHRADVYSAGVVLWEILTGKRLFQGDAGAVLTQILLGERIPPSQFAPNLDKGWNQIVLKATSLQPDRRYATAQEMADAVESMIDVASGRVVGQWVTRLLGETLVGRETQIRAIEQWGDPCDLPKEQSDAELSVSTRIEHFSRGRPAGRASLPSASDTNLPGAGDASFQSIGDASVRPSMSDAGLGPSDLHLPSLRPSRSDAGLRPSMGDLRLPSVRPSMDDVSLLPGLGNDAEPHHVAGYAPVFGDDVQAVLPADGLSSRRRSRWFFIGAGALFLAAGGAFFGSRFGWDITHAAGPGEGNTEGADPVGSTGGTVLTAASSPVLHPVAEVPPSITDDPSLPVASSTSTASPITPIVKPHDRNPRTGGSSLHPSTGSLPKTPDCKNPFVVGPDGDMHVRRECL